MIGQRVTGTLWIVSWKHMAPVGDSTEYTAPVQGRQFVITADPSGGDLLEVTRMVVLGAKAVPAHQFMLLGADRSADVSGLAQLPTEDRGWPAHFTTGAALLQITERQAAAAHDLGKRLLLEQKARESTERELNALRLLANVVAADPMLAPRYAELLEPAKAARERTTELDWMAAQVPGGAT